MIIIHRCIPRQCVKKFRKNKVILAIKYYIVLTFQGQEIEKNRRSFFLTKVRSETWIFDIFTP